MLIGGLEDLEKVRKALEEGIPLSSLAQKQPETVVEKTEPVRTGPRVLVATEKVALKPEEALLVEEPGFGRIHMTIGNCGFGEKLAEGALSWATVEMEEELDNVFLNFLIEPEPGVRVLRIEGSPLESDLSDVTGFSAMPFRVPIQWKSGIVPHGKVPQVAKLHDINFALVRPNGELAHHEFSFHARRGLSKKEGTKFDIRGLYVSQQRMYHGQVVKIDEGRFDTVPMSVENAYPGNEYKNNTAVGAEQVVTYAIQQGAFIPMDEAAPAQWLPAWPELPEGLAKSGFEAAVVQWFNPSGGYGKLRLAEGDECFAHMKSILGRDLQPAGRKNGVYPVLCPGHGVAVQWEEGDQGPKATAVISLN